MKKLLLWQKIYLSVITILLLSMVILSISLIFVNFSASLEVSTENAIYRHHVITDSIQNKIAYKQMSTNVLNIEDIDFQKIVKEVSISETESIYVYKNNKIIIKTNKSFENVEKDFPAVPLSKDKDYYVIKNIDGKYLLFVASNAIFVSDGHTIISSYDVTNTYLQSKNQAYICVTICIVAALLMSLILFFVINILFAPLKKVQKNINEIAAGNYDAEISISSNDEIAQLAQSTNVMRSAIRENIYKAQKLADSRKNFIDNLSHEMKTPLTSILGYADMLRISADISEEKRIQYASVIVDETKRLKALSNKLMELISIENYSLSELKPINIKELFDEISAITCPMAEIKNITIYTKSVSLELTVDILLFKSMLLNIMDNAIKATADGGKIELLSKICDSQIYITIKDNGIGIKENEIEKITEPFYMIDKFRSRKNYGSGLGLALCKKIADLHHAKLKIASEINKGTSVTIIIEKGGN